MKFHSVVIVIFFSFIGHSSAEWSDESRWIESEQVALWEQKIKEARAAPTEMRTAQLWLGLRNMGHRNSLKGRSPEVQEIYYKIRDELLSIPGHARYLADQIKREQKEVASYPTNTGPRVTYDFNRAMHFNTLALLPSPETISVLGEFLSDDIDTPRRLETPGSDWGENPRANSFAASVTIAATGLRDTPADKKSYETDPEAHLAKTRVWWEEVKSGKRAFSFKGQSIDYRFNPDGTWDTIPISNPPDDGPKPTTETMPDRLVKKTMSAQADYEEASHGPSWWWYGIGGATLLAAGAWLWRKKRTA